jgi:CBS-domain-containing membrane protein
MPQLLCWLYRALGASVAIAIMEVLARIGHHELPRLPFITSIVLTTALPDSEAARPYAVVVGHLLSAASGFAVLWTLGSGDMASATAVGLAVLLMLLCRAVHPPAGIDAFLVVNFSLTADWILNPVLVGALLLALYSRLWAAGERRLPMRR